MRHQINTTAVREQQKPPKYGDLIVVKKYLDFQGFIEAPLTVMRLRFICEVTVNIYLKAKTTYAWHVIP